MGAGARRPETITVTATIMGTTITGMRTFTTMKMEPNTCTGTNITTETFMRMRALV